MSIQSRVTSGYVGNAVATPILQRLGRTVWPVDTVVFSNHPAHGSHTGGVRPAAEVETLIDGLQAQNLLAGCEAVLSGYLGSAETGPVVRAAAEKARQSNADALWCCDPVMGDQGEFYVADGIPAFFRDSALPAADMILPNLFEASYLAGIAVSTADDATRAAKALLRKGPATVVITGVRQGGDIGAIVANADGCWRCMAPRIDAPAYGAGDAFAALFTGFFLTLRDAPGALGHAVSGVHEILRATADAQSKDLDLIAALPALDDLSPRPAERLS